MKKSYIISLILLIIMIMSSVHLYAQSVEVIDTAALDNIINDKGVKTKIISFWATWCKPCVEELPYLEQLNISGKAEVVLISLDFIEDLDTKVYNFVTLHEITSRICLLNNVDYNSWINMVDHSWTGAIPATLVINPVSGKRKFLVKQIQEGELENLLDEVNN